jgi:hypothetical protein
MFPLTASISKFLSDFVSTGRSRKAKVSGARLCLCGLRLINALMYISHLVASHSDELLPRIEAMHNKTVCNL